ncbi:hypothetical protein GBAR_LOCUS22722, partial [Geodia barretti]
MPAATTLKFTTMKIEDRELSNLIARLTLKIFPFLQPTIYLLQRVGL